MMNERFFRIAAIGGVLMLSFIAYLNTFSGEWVWDDVSSVLLHKHVQDPSQFFQLFREDQHAFGRGQGNFYRPLVAASFMLDFKLSYDPNLDAPKDSTHPDVKPFVFHFTNILWHAAAAVLLFVLLTQLGAPQFVRAVVAGLFVVHPLHTEAVAYISGRADMMSAAFIFAGLIFATLDVSGRKQAAAWVACALCFCAGLVCKESTTIFPLLLALFVFLRPLPESIPDRKQIYLRRGIPLAGALVLLIVYAVLRSTVLKFAEKTPGVDHPLGQRLVETFQAFASYIRLLFLPTGLHMERTLDQTPAWTAAIGCVLFVACVALLLWAIRAKQHRIALGMGWFLLAWLPISGIFPLNAPMAEHWMYVPMAGFWWALAELVWRFAPTLRLRQIAAGAFCLLAVLFAGLTVDRNRDWHDNERLFRATLHENPNSLRVAYNLAVSYEDLLREAPQARRLFEHLLEQYQGQKRESGLTANDLTADEIDVRLSLGRLCMKQGDYMKALRYLYPVANAVKDDKLRGPMAAASMAIAQCSMAMGDLSTADQFARQAAQADPGYGRDVRDLFQGGPLPGPS